MELVWVIITLLLLHFRHNSLPLCGLHKTESAEVPLRNLGGKIFIREGRGNYRRLFVQIFLWFHHSKNRVLEVLFVSCYDIIGSSFNCGKMLQGILKISKFRL